MGNILICQDLIRLYNRSSVSPRCMMKIDFRKAYDSIEWSFLAQIFKALNFPPNFLNCIMECVSSPSYTLYLNEDQLRFF